MRNLEGKEGQVIYATGSRLRTRGAYWRLLSSAVKDNRKMGTLIECGVNNGKRRFEGLARGMAVG